MDHPIRWPRGFQPDPITEDQIRALDLMLGGHVAGKELAGFFVVCSRLVDEFGAHRTAELASMFRTDTAAGRTALRDSLRYVNRWVGGYSGYVARYPVSINPSRPAYPLLKIVGIHTLAPVLYRVMDSRATVGKRKIPMRRYIERTGKLPPKPRQSRPVRRSKPSFHWCSYDAWATPDETQRALQILPKWSNCRLRATLPTSRIRGSAFVAFNGDEKDSGNPHLKFVKYFVELIAQDHPELSGGGLQIGVQGAPYVSRLEEWNPHSKTWVVL